MRAQFKRLVWEWRGVLITAPSITGLVILMRWYCLLQPSELSIFDQYMRLRSPERPDNRIVLVGIDETDIKECCFVQSGDLAQLLEKIAAQQPRAIGLNISGHLLGEQGHDELVRVINNTPNLIVIKRMLGKELRSSIAPPDEIQAKVRVGSSNLIEDADKRVRRSLLYMTSPNGETVYSLGMYLAMVYLTPEGINLKPLEGMKFQLGKAIFSPLKANDGGYEPPIDNNGYQTILNYRQQQGRFDTVSMTDILQNRIPPNWGRNRIILIGTVGESFQSSVLTPYSGGLHNIPLPIPEVEVHAHLTSQIISSALDNRPLIKSWSEPLEYLWILLWAGIGAALSWKARYVSEANKFLFQRSASIFVAGGALIGSTYIAFLYGWWIPVVPPFMAMAVSAIVVIGYIARTAGEIRKTFGRYLTDSVVANLLEHPEGLKLGGERRTITILTSDLRGFTSLSERLTPEEVIKILNFYLGAMADVITKHQGTIDEFMGDGILVLFGAPTPRADDAKRAIACAVDMQLAMGAVNQKMKEWDLSPLEMGIGINTGEVVVGNIGSEKRTKYGIVGANVNLTYRIESYTVGGQILISESTLKESESMVSIAGQKQVTPKGVQQPITIYEVAGMGGKYNLFLPQVEDIFFPLDEALPLQYTILDGKHISTTTFLGHLVKLSEKGAEIRTDPTSENAIPSRLSNIKLNLLNPNNRTKTSLDIYAKVLEKTAKEPGSFYIYFTAKPSEVAAQLDALYKLISEKSRIDRKLQILD